MPNNSSLENDKESKENINDNESIGVVVIGNDPSRPIVRIQAMASCLDFEAATPVSGSDGNPIIMLSAMLQALPAVLVAGEASGSRIMEVVVNGELARAADGNGVRAFVLGADGIKENARLFDAARLQNLLNASAIWQIASVVVAQKHLADISRKLDEIRSGVREISKFLSTQRRSRIKSSCEYIDQVYAAIQGGELPASARVQLENCERDLLEIQDHLAAEYMATLDCAPQDGGLFGSEKIAKNISDKIKKINDLVGDISLCIKSRLLCWHVLSLYPGDTNLKAARQKSILRSIEIYEGLGVIFQKRMYEEVEAISAFWSTEEAINRRKAMLHVESGRLIIALGRDCKDGRDRIHGSNKLLLESGQPMRLLFQYDGADLVSVRQGA